MSKASVFENKAFQSAPAGIGFNLVSHVNSFNSVFDTRPLDEDEAYNLEVMLTQQAEDFSVEKVSEDAEILKQITAEIKAIGKQGAILLGERVHRARELLKPYKDGTFTRWLETAFGTRKTGYNVLAYYELYRALPHDKLRDDFKKLQQRTAYILASREGDLGTKAEIIREYHDKPHAELIEIIQEKLPIASSDKRASKISAGKILAELRENVELLRKTAPDFTDKEIWEIAKIRDALASLLK